MNQKQLEKAAERTNATLTESNLFPMADQVPTQPTKKRGRKPQPQNDNRLAVTYWIDSAAAENIKAIAVWERKTNNEVVNEAIKQYCKHWKPSQAPQPPTLKPL